MNKEQAVRYLANAIYKVAIIFEKWEHEGKVQGNGHHIAQDIAAYAEHVVQQRYEDDAKE